MEKVADDVVLLSPFLILLGLRAVGGARSCVEPWSTVGRHDWDSLVLLLQVSRFMTLGVMDHIRYLDEFRAITAEWL